MGGGLPARLGRVSAAPRTVAVVIPAKDEAERIAATVRAAATIDGVDLVVVVDDGSSDDTAAVARDAGAEIVRHERNHGKGTAMQTGAAYVARHEGETDSPHALLFVDADLEDSVVETAALTAPVLAGRGRHDHRDPPDRSGRAGGGRGFVVRLAREGVEKLTGWTPTQPLSGMRCLSRDAFEAALPLAKGWGVEVGLTIDLLRQGMRVVEVPCDLHHRVTGTDLRAQLHRARQYRDVWRALAVRRHAAAEADCPTLSEAPAPSAGRRALAPWALAAVAVAGLLLLGTAALGPSAASPALPAGTGWRATLPPWSLGVERDLGADDGAARRRVRHRRAGAGARPLGRLPR